MECIVSREQISHGYQPGTRYDFRIRGIAKRTRRVICKFARSRRVYPGLPRLERPFGVARCVHVCSQYTRPAEEVMTPLVIEMTRRTPECASPFSQPLAYVHRDRKPRLMLVYSVLFHLCLELKGIRLLKRKFIMVCGIIAFHFGRLRQNESKIKDRYNYQVHIHYTFSTFNIDSYPGNYAVLAAIAPTICN